MYVKQIFLRCITLCLFLFEVKCRLYHPNWCIYFKTIFPGWSFDLSFERSFPLWTLLSFAIWNNSCQTGQLQALILIWFWLSVCVVLDDLNTQMWLINFSPAPNYGVQRKIRVSGSTECVTNKFGVICPLFLFICPEIYNWMYSFVSVNSAACKPFVEQIQQSYAVTKVLVCLYWPSWTLMNPNTGVGETMVCEWDHGG